MVGRREGVGAMRGPSQGQELWIWRAATGLAVAVVGGGVVGGLWVVVRAAMEFYEVLLPLGVAAVVAYMVEPVIGWLCERGMGRVWAVGLVGLGMVGVVGGGVAWVGPRVVEQGVKLVQDVPEGWAWVKERGMEFTERYPRVQEWVRERVMIGVEGLPGWVGENVGMVWRPLEEFWDGVVLGVGLLLVPVYVFYFLVEKEGIARHWREDASWREGWLGRELEFVIEQVNGYMAAFFRGQVVVALFVGVATGVGLSLIGLPYGAFLGLVCGVLSVVPHLGVLFGGVAAVGLAWVNTEHWVQPALVVGVFGVVQVVEGLWVSPRVMGRRRGLHPVMVIVGVLVWSELLPGFLGVILAIPLTAVVRVLVYRCVWGRAVPVGGGALEKGGEG
jgi:predicted PurR-regulated permease PerM